MILVTGGAGYGGSDTFFPFSQSGFGKGCGYSVLDVIEVLKIVRFQPEPYENITRRAGNIAQCGAGPSCANDALGGSAKRVLEEMYEDSGRWHKENKKGLK